MDRSVALTTIRGGINRLRTKGSAPNDSLYDLVNGYVTAAKTVKIRPGSFRRAILDETTRGLVAFDGSFHVFASEEVEVPDGYVLHVAAHPDATLDNPIAIDRVNKAFPFMGYIYASITFDNDDTFHYWFQTGDAWEADTVYKLGDIVTPATPTGFSYQAQRLDEPRIAWAPNVNRTEGDEVEPTVYNDFFYTVVETQGDSPRSGATEPDWPLTDGAQVIEDADGSTTAPTTPTDMPDPNAQPAPGTSDRYDNIFARGIGGVFGE